MPDIYIVTARVRPLLAAAAPALALLAASVSSPTAWLRASGGVGGVLGLIAVALVRDRGREIQTRLWADWGGSPTVALLRFAGQDRDVVERLHARVEGATGLTLPVEVEEATDPSAADARYAEAVDALRSMTRDRSRFRILFNENIDYGFRRNALGLRPVAIGIALAAIVTAVILLFVSGGSLPSRTIRFAPVAAISIALLGWWWLVVSPGWVRLAADRYARQLLDSTYLRESASGRS
jgi:hypothetical protein